MTGENLRGVVTPCLKDDGIFERLVASESTTLNGSLREQFFSATLHPVTAWDHAETEVNNRLSNLI